MDIIKEKWEEILYTVKLEHELTLLKKNEIKHEIRMTHLKLTEENEKKQDYIDEHSTRLNQIYQDN